MAQSLATPIQPQGDMDDAAIRRAAQDYVESWYDGDAARLERCVHPDLVKRAVRPNDSPSHPWPPGDFLYEISAMRLAQLTRHEPLPAPERTDAVILLDRFENIASVKILGADDVEYLHVAKCNGRWVIVNVLWGLRQGTPSSADDAAIMRTAWDYVSGDATVERCLHPELAKRTVGPIQAPSPEWPSPSWPPGDKLYHLSALGLAQPFRPLTAPPAEVANPNRVTMLDRVENGASVRTDGKDNVDYLHIAMWNGQWLIVNVLWELRPEARPY